MKKIQIEASLCEKSRSVASESESQKKYFIFQN